MSGAVAVTLVVAAAWVVAVFLVLDVLLGDRATGRPPLLRVARFARWWLSEARGEVARGGRRE